MQIYIGLGVALVVIATVLSKAFGKEESFSVSYEDIDDGSEKKTKKASSKKKKVSSKKAKAEVPLSK